MNNLTLINTIPSTLDITELMEVKGGISDTVNNICIFKSAVNECKGDYPAVVVCKGDYPAIANCPSGSAVASCDQGSAVSTDPPTPDT